MSGKLDQSLDDILKTQRRSATRAKRGRGARRASQPGRADAPAAPVGGVQKNPKQAKGAVKAIPTGPSAGSGESRIQVSNLVCIPNPSAAENCLTSISAQGCERSPD
jgi:THO complex subunit 4